MKAREPRRKVLIGARMRIDGHWADVQILDASSRGFLIHTPHSPPRGSYVEVCRGRRRYVARVVWQANQRCGVQTQDSLNVDDLIKPPETHKASIASIEPAVERREQRRVSESIKCRGEASRHIGKMVEYLTIAGFGGAAAVLIFGGLIDLLDKPLARVSETLSPSTKAASYQGSG